MAKELSLRDIEQRRKILAVDISNTKRNIENGRKGAENPDYTPAERADSKRFYDKQVAKLADLEKQSKELEEYVSQSGKQARASFLREEIAGLRKQYDLKLDKGSPEATALKSKLGAKEKELAELTRTSTTKRATETTTFGPPEVQGGVTVTTTPTPTPVPTPAPTPTPTPTPAPTPTKQPPAKVAPIPPEEVKQKPDTLESILKKTEFWYDLPDYIFQTVPELGKLLVKAINEKWDDAKFLSKAKLTKWWQSNSATVRQRIVDKASYEELRAAGEDVSKSNYGQYLSSQMNAVKAKARQIAGVALTDEQAQQVADKIYTGNLDSDPLAITKLITPFIGKTTDRYAKTDVTTYGGQALQDYQTLQAIAKANGLTLKDVLPQISAVTTGGDIEKAVLQGIATGDIDIRKVAQNARTVAAQGQPEYVRNLLNQGYDLEQVYAPYKNVMANVLEVADPNQIDLNDPTLRSAITNNGDMNIFDFKKALRKDSRWQYTENAKDEMTNTAMNLLRNFGFVG